MSGPIWLFTHFTFHYRKNYFRRKKVTVFITKILKVLKSSLRIFCLIFSAKKKSFDAKNIRKKNITLTVSSRKESMSQRSAWSIERVLIVMFFLHKLDHDIGYTCRFVSESQSGSTLPFPEGFTDGS